MPLDHLDDLLIASTDDDSMFSIRPTYHSSLSFDIVCPKHFILFPTDPRLEAIIINDASLACRSRLGLSRI